MAKTSVQVCTVLAIEAEEAEIPSGIAKRALFRPGEFLSVDGPGLKGFGPPEFSLVAPDKAPPRSALKVWRVSGL